MSSASGQKYEGSYWAFTPDGKQFFSLRLYDENPHDSDLLVAYRRHPKRLPDGVNVEFVYRDETNKRIAQRWSMADIIASEKEMQEIMEDAYQQDQVVRRKAALAEASAVADAARVSGVPPWSR
jgi:hypothetical protein